MARMAITAAVDGSALGNPGPAGWAWVVSEECWDAGGWPRATNNQGELTAVLELLRATAAVGRADEPLHVLADSQYTINVITKWRLGWRRRGWQKADKKPIANLTVIQDIDREIETRAVTFEWVRGHAGHTLNELADSHARGVALAIQAGLPVPTGPGFGGGSGAGVPGVAGARGRASVRDEGDSPAPRDRERSAAPLTEPLDESAVATAAEKRFIRAWIAGDARGLETLAAPGARRVWPDGSVLAGVAGPAPSAPRIGRITAVAAGPGAWLTTYDLRWDGGSSTESSVWVPAVNAAGLRLLWHQSTFRS